MSKQEKTSGVYRDAIEKLQQIQVGLKEKGCNVCMCVPPPTTVIRFKPSDEEPPEVTYDGGDFGYWCEKCKAPIVLLNGDAFPNGWR